MALPCLAVTLAKLQIDTGAAKRKAAASTGHLSGKFPLKEKCQHNLTERVAAAAAPNQGAVVHLDKVPLAASPLLPATHEK